MKPALLLLPGIACAALLCTAGCTKHPATPAEAEKDFETRYQSLVSARYEEDSKREKALMDRLRELVRHKPPEGEAEALRVWQDNQDAVWKQLKILNDEAMQMHLRLAELEKAWKAAEWKGYVIPDNFADSAGAGWPDPPPPSPRVK